MGVALEHPRRTVAAERHHSVIVAAAAIVWLSVLRPRGALSVPVPRAAVGFAR
jgi:hypothetical protein